MTSQQKASIAKGVGLGVAVGGAAGLVGGALRKPGFQRGAKKTVNRAIKTFTNVLDALQ
ncbi:MAG: hypothetical protein LBC83_06280 [Oscillospiraceae bacterium]|jgi:hypothetical protein|nr:hypothetical protein [Oscillospiraceae bacterium]